LVGTVNMQDAAPLRPYDGVGWTLQIQMGVEALEMARPLDDSVALSRVESVAISPGAVIGSGRQFVFPHTDNNSLSAARAILAAGGSVSWSLEPMTIDGATHPPGTFVVAAGSIDRRELERIVASRGITLRGGRVDAPTAPLSNPRLAIYKSWVANMDAGWLRWVCERYGFAYHLLTDAEVRAGGLRDRFDVILLSDQGAGSIVNGHRKGTIPPDYVGGITRAGVENLKAFVRGGGVLVCNKGSAELAIDAFELPVRNALRGSGRGEFNIPGSIVKMNYDVAHPIAFGMTERGVAYFDGGARGYDIGPFEEEEGESSEASTEQTSGARGARGARGGQRGSGRGGRGGQAATSSARAESGPTPNVVARFPEESLLVSGWETGADQLEGKAAVLEAKVGDGRVVIFGFNAVNRAQAFSTFKLLLNALYYR
jgi:hypothetical protein